MLKKLLLNAIGDHIIIFSLSGSLHGLMIGTKNAKGKLSETNEQGLLIVLETGILEN
ncbi:hypothetical protein P4534_16545 [Peribacillus butanolivorans]|uniref:hypothetical protein n=1 Tax=Peribacillus butanolivorans TaxID=421767 RepID=UPI002E1BA485|nr:hypothetical protein [Peribacillus butanolivorans]